MFLLSPLHYVPTTYMAFISKIRGITFFRFCLWGHRGAQNEYTKKGGKNYHCVFLISQKGLLVARLRDLIARHLPKAWKQEAFLIQGINCRDPRHFLTIRHLDDTNSLRALFFPIKFQTSLINPNWYLQCILNLEIFKDNDLLSLRDYCKYTWS